MAAESRPTGAGADVRVALVTVRLVEGAALVLLLAAGHELWSAWQNAGVDGFLGRGAVFLDRIWSVVHNQARGPVAVVVAALLLAGCLWAANGSRPLWRWGERGPTPAAAASSVRVEVAVLGVVGLLLALAGVVVVVVAATVPYGPELGPSPLAPGEDRLTVLLPVAAWPLAGVLLYAALGCLWWLSGRAAPDAPAAEATVDVAHPVTGTEADSAAAPALADGEVSGGAGAPRVSGDGSTTNGYEEYFRRG